MQTICKNKIKKEILFLYLKVIIESKLSTEAISLYLRAITSQHKSIGTSPSLFSMVSFFISRQEMPSGFFEDINFKSIPNIFAVFNLEFNDYPPIPDSAWDPDESIEALVNKIALEA